MTHKITWLVTDRVIEVILPENLSDDVVLALDPDMCAMLDTASKPVHIVIDVRALKTYPSAQTSMKMKYYRHPHMGRLILIGMTSNPVMRFLGSLVGRGAGIQMKDFGTREEAFAYLASLEQTEK